MQVPTQLFFFKKILLIRVTVCMNSNPLSVLTRAPKGDRKEKIKEFFKPKNSRRNIGVTHYMTDVKFYEVTPAVISYLFNSQILIWSLRSSKLI